jgi:hypothetical protein
MSDWATEARRHSEESHKKAQNAQKINQAIDRMKLGLFLDSVLI